MNKKGIITFTPLVILAILTLLVGFFLLPVFIFSSSMRWILIGIGLFIGSVYIMGSVEDTRTKTIFSVLLVGLGVFFVFGHGFIQSFTEQAFISADGYFEAPFFATVKCDEAKGGAKLSNSVSAPAEGRYFKCPDNTKNCDILFSFPSRGTWTTERRTVYRTCTSNRLSTCGSSYSTTIPISGVTDLKIITNLPRDSYAYVKFEASKFPLGYKTSPEDGTIRYSFIPYVLWKKDSLRGGENVISGSTDCKVPTNSIEWKERIISSDFKDTEKKEASIRESNNILEPSATYNYISGFVTRALIDGNFIRYKGEEGYCADNIQGTSRAIIYKLANLETSTTVYKIVDLNTELGREDCCQEGQLIGDTVCKNFKLEKIQVDENTGVTNIACSLTSLTNPCNPGRFTLSDTDKTTFEYQCENNFCVVGNIENVECTRTSQCGNNEVCNNYKCEKASTINEGVGEDKSGQTTKSQAETDCETKDKLNPLAGWTYVKKTKEPSGFDKFLTVVSLGTIGDLTPSTEESCESKLAPIWIFAGVILVLGLVIFFTGKKKGRKK